MNNPSINIKSKHCQKHNQPLRYYDQNGRNPQCEGCLLEKSSMFTVEQIQKQHQEKIINHIKENDSQLQQLNELKDGILKYKEIIITSLDKSIQQIIDQIKRIQSEKQSISLDHLMNKYESIDDLTSYLNNYQKSNIHQRNKILMNLLQDFKSNVLKTDFLHSIQQIILQTQVLMQIQIPEVTPYEQMELNMMEYNLIQQVNCKKWIYDFAIDQKNNILIAGMRSGYIKIYKFQDGKLGAEIQSLQAHTNDVYCLYYMKNTQNFISGSYDNSIKIWCLDRDKWEIQQILNDHKSFVNCIIMNSKEDLLISGSDDKTIKFWRKLTDSWDLSQTCHAGDSVLSLSLNENEDKLIAGIKCNSITVMNNNQSDQEWKVIQTIKVNEFGFRLCFTIQNQFVFQPKTSDYLEVYDFTNKLQFCLKKKIKVQSVEYCYNYFPCQYIKNLKILTVKLGQFLNIFKVCQNGEYQLIQSIEYQFVLLFGRMTDDGEYLITWDKKSKEIQVRKLEYKEQLLS